MEIKSTIKPSSTQLDKLTLTFTEMSEVIYLRHIITLYKAYNNDSTSIEHLCDALAAVVYNHPVDTEFELNDL